MRKQGDTRYQTNLVLTITNTGGISIEFSTAEGWDPPESRTLTVAFGGTTRANFPYRVKPPSLVFQPGLGLGLTGTTATVYQLQRRDRLETGGWSNVLMSRPLTNGFNLLLPWPPTNGPASFYRATWVP